MSDLYMYICVFLCVCDCSVLPQVGTSHPASHTVCLIDVKQGVGYSFSWIIDSCILKYFI